MNLSLETVLPLACRGARLPLVHFISQSSSSILKDTRAPLYPLCDALLSLGSPSSSRWFPETQWSSKRSICLQWQCVHATSIYPSLNQSWTRSIQLKRAMTPNNSISHRWHACRSWCTAWRLYTYACIPSRRYCQSSKPRKMHCVISSEERQRWPSEQVDSQWPYRHQHALLQSWILKYDGLPCLLFLSALILRTFQLIFIAGTVLFSHNKSAGIVFQFIFFSEKRTEPLKSSDLAKVVRARIVSRMVHWIGSTLKPVVLDYS